MNECVRCTACRKSANLPGPAWQNEACSRPHHSNNFGMWKLILANFMFKIITAYTNLTKRKPVMSPWLCTQHKITFLLVKVKKTHSHFTIPITGSSSFIYFKVLMNAQTSKVKIDAESDNLIEITMSDEKR